MSTEGVEITIMRVRRSIQRERTWVDAVGKHLAGRPVLEDLLDLESCSHEGECPLITPVDWNKAFLALALQTCASQQARFSQELTAEVDAQSRLLYFLESMRRDKEIGERIINHATMEPEFRISRYEENDALSVQAFLHLIKSSKDRGRAHAAINGLGEKGSGLVCGITDQGQVVFLHLSGVRLGEFLAHA